MRLPAAFRLLLLLMGLSLTGCAFTFGPIHAKAPEYLEHPPLMEHPSATLYRAYISIPSAARDLECPNGMQKDYAPDWIDVFGPMVPYTHVEDSWCCEDPDVEYNEYPSCGYPVEYADDFSDEDPLPKCEDMEAGTGGTDKPEEGQRWCCDDIPYNEYPPCPTSGG